MYYGRAVDNKLLPALSAIGAQQAAATVNTNRAVAPLPDYVATYPADGIVYRAKGVLDPHGRGDVAVKVLNRAVLSKKKQGEGTALDGVLKEIGKLTRKMDAEA